MGFSFGKVGGPCVAAIGGREPIFTPMGEGFLCVPNHPNTRLRKASCSVEVRQMAM